MGLVFKNALKYILSLYGNENEQDNVKQDRVISQEYDHYCLFDMNSNEMNNGKNAQLLEKNYPTRKPKAYCAKTYE